MKLIKKTALLLALLSLSSLCITACGGEKPATSGSSENESVSLESEESVTSDEEPSVDESYIPEPPETVWSEWEAVTEPTCDADGKKTRFDVNDPTVTETAQIPARGHDYSGENITCIRCGIAELVDTSTLGQDFPYVDICTHTDTEIYEGNCDCEYKGRGEEYSRLELSEGCYTVETVSNGEITNALWLSFSVKEAGQYMLCSVDNNDKVTAARYDASSHYITPVPYNAMVKDGDFFSYVSCTEKHFNEEWRATFCLKAEAGTPVKIAFVKFADAAWERKNVFVPTYPTEINGVKAPDAPADSKAVEVDYDSEYYYSDPAFGGDGYYHLQGTDEVIFAAINTTPSRLLMNGSFTTIHYEGSALNLQDGYTADGDYRIRSYVPFIMNCADDNDIFNEELAPNLNKNCYQNYCNADGMYPVNKELFHFLNLYVQNTKPIDSNITVEDFMNKEDWLWLSACYVYKPIKSGTEDNPLALALGENNVQLPAWDSLFCTIKMDGLYTISCEAEGTQIAIGQDVLLSSPFAVTVETTEYSPIRFTLASVDGKAAAATVSVSPAVGVSNGLGAEESKPYVLENLGTLTLETVTVYGADGNISYYAYYAFTATEEGTLCLTVTEETTASVMFNDVYVTEDEARIEVAKDDVVIIYVSNADTPASVNVEIFYIG